LDLPSAFSAIPEVTTGVAKPSEKVPSQKNSIVEFLARISFEVSHKKAGKKSH